MTMNAYGPMPQSMQASVPSASPQSTLATSGGPGTPLGPAPSPQPASSPAPAPQATPSAQQQQQSALGNALSPQQQATMGGTASSATVLSGQLPNLTFPPGSIGQLFDISNERLSLNESQVLEALSLLTPDIDIQSIRIDYNHILEQIIPNINCNLILPINNEFLEDFYFSYLRFRIVRVSDSLFGNPTAVDWMNNYEDLMKDNPVLAAIDLDDITKLGGQFIFSDMRQKVVNVENIYISSGIRSMTLGDNLYFKIKGNTHPNLIQKLGSDTPNNMYYIFHTFIDFRQLLRDYGINVDKTNLPIDEHQHGKALIVNALTGEATRYYKIESSPSAGGTTYSLGLQWQGPVHDKPTATIDPDLQNFLDNISDNSNLYSSYDVFYAGTSFDVVRTNSSLGSAYGRMETRKPAPAPLPLAPMPMPTPFVSVPVPPTLGPVLPISPPLPLTSAPLPLPKPGSNFNGHPPAPVASPAQYLFDIDLFGILKEVTGNNQIGMLLNAVPELLDNFFIDTARVYRTRISKGKANAFSEELVAKKIFGDLEDASENYQAQLFELNINTQFSNPHIKNMVLIDRSLTGDDGDAYQYRIELDIANNLGDSLALIFERLLETQGRFNAYRNQFEVRVGDSGIDFLEPEQRRGLYEESGRQPPWIFIAQEIGNLSAIFGIPDPDQVAASFLDKMHPLSATTDSISEVGEQIQHGLVLMQDLLDSFGIAVAGRKQSKGLKNRFTYESDFNFRFENTGAGYSYLPSIAMSVSEGQLGTLGIQSLGPDALRGERVLNLIPTSVKLPNGTMEDISPDDEHKLLQTKIVLLNKTGKLLVEQISEQPRDSNVLSNQQSIQSIQKQLAAEDDITVELILDLEEQSEVSILESEKPEELEILELERDNLEQRAGEEEDLTFLYDALLAGAKYDVSGEKEEYNIPQGSFLAELAPMARIEVFLGYRQSENGGTLIREPIFRQLTPDDIENKPPGAYLCRIEQSKGEYSGLSLPVINKYFLLGRPLDPRPTETSFEFVDIISLEDRNTSLTNEDLDNIETVESEEMELEPAMVEGTVELAGTGY